MNSTPDNLPMLDQGGLVFAAPEREADWPAWRTALAQWRERERARIRYNGAAYDCPAFAFTQRDFVCYFLMLSDQLVLQPGERELQIDRVIDYGLRNFGGFDSIVLWHAYPQIGFDDRNQFDFYRDQPGGLAGLRALIGKAHARDVRIYLNYNPWDVATRREGVSDETALAELFRQTHADGLFLDTLENASPTLRQSLDAVRDGIAFESELALPLTSVADHHISWGQWFSDTHAPGVIRNRWFEQRHMMHMIKRWHTDRTEVLHQAFMNGAGVLVWDNVFGSMVPWSPRDQSLLRAMASIQRRYARHFSHGEWTPLLPTGVSDVFASRWTLDGQSLYTLINRSNESRTVPLANLDPRLAPIDLLRGIGATELHLPPRGLNAAVSGLADNAFLQARREDFCRYDDNAAPPTLAISPATVETGNTFEMIVRYRNRECGLYAPATRATNNDLHKMLTVTRTVAAGHKRVARHAVTNAEYHDFIVATGYQPVDAYRFLAHWVKGAPRLAERDQPVRYVSVEDAIAYARWRGGELVDEAAWHLAAQQGQIELTQPRLWEFVGPVRSDGRVRFIILRGGCDTELLEKPPTVENPQGNPGWYPGASPPAFELAAKYLLSCPRLDRAATITFRIATDQ